MTKPSIGYLIDYREERGYVERLPDPSDKRAQLVRSTERGWEMSRTGRRLVREAEARRDDLIGEAGVEDLRQRLRGRIAALGDTAGGQGT
jgi:DNA-binding MarR family transcriptional regulator